jgi:uncharacterized protein (TIGR02466 family)
MEKGLMLPIFPTVVTMNKMERYFTEDEMNCFMSFKDKLRYTYPNTLDIYILDNEPLIELKNICERALNNYLLEINKPINPNDIRLKITHSWLNFTKKEQYHPPHTHHNSILCGVLYVNANKEKDKIVFTKMDSGENWQIQTNNQKNIFSSNTFELSVGTGDIVIFPSNLTHSVPLIEDENRLSLAFNSFYSGNIGFIEGPLKGINFVKIDLPNQKENKPL